MSKSITPIIERQIAKARKTGLSIPALAKRFGYSTTTISRVLRMQGLGTWTPR